MFCSKCGAQNEPGAGFCSKCGAPLAAQAGTQAPPSVAAINIANIPSYLVQAILVTLFCCLPFGIVAIVKAAQVSKMQGLGSYDLALKASGEAKMWCWISFGCGIGAILIYVVFVAFLGFLGIAANSGASG